MEQNWIGAEQKDVERTAQAACRKGNELSIESGGGHTIG